MNKEEVEKLIKDYAEMHEKLQKVIKQFEAAETEEKSKEWKPKYWERYYYVSNIFTAKDNIYVSDEIDKTITNYRKIFKTEKEAQEYADYLKAIAERTYKFSKEEWEDVKLEKYCIYYNGSKKELVADEWYKDNYFCKFTFKTKEEAKDFIAEYGSMILKYEF